MAYINFPSVDQLKTMPVNQRDQYILWLSGNGVGYDQSGHGAALINLANQGNWGELQYQLPIMQNEMKKFWDKASEYTQRVKEYENSPLKTEAQKNWEGSAKYYLSNLNQQYNNAPDFIRGDAPPTYDQLYNQTAAVNPYSKEGVVGSKEWEEMTKLNSQPGIAVDQAQGITEPMVGMTSANGETRFIPQSQVQSFQAQGWGVIPDVNVNQGQTNIPFKDGLSDAQKASITKLSSKPIDQWNDTDKANWAYATNGAPLPQIGSTSSSSGMTNVDIGTNTGAGDFSGVDTTGSTDQGASDMTVGGVDMTGWPDSLKQAYQAMSDMVAEKKSQGLTFNPNLTIDQATLDKFKEQAKTELSPYYGQLFSQAEADLKKAVEGIKEDYAGKTRDIGLQYGQALEGAQENYARRGLEFSSTRDKSEDMLANQATTALEDAAKAAEKQAYSIGTEAERAIGSANMPSVDFGVSTYSPITKKAGQYGLTGATGNRNLFSNVGNTTGSYERSKIFDTESRYNQLKEAEEANLSRRQLDLLSI